MDSHINLKIKVKLQECLIDFFIFFNYKTNR